MATLLNKPARPADGDNEGDKREKAGMSSTPRTAAVDAPVAADPSVDAAAGPAVGAPANGAADAGDTGAATATPAVPESAGQPHPRGLKRLLGVGLGTSRARSWKSFFVLFVVADIVIAAIAIALVSGHADTGPSTAPAGSQPTAPAAQPTLPSATPQLGRTLPASWISRELPKTAGVLAADPLRTQLIVAGFGKVVSPSAATPGSVQYIVSTAAVRSAAKRNAVLAQQLAYSAPIAVFGTGTSRVEVRQATSTPDASRKAHHAAGVSLRAEQERQLLENKALTFNADGTKILRAGGLDLRAASVLAQIAGTTPVRVQIVVDPAEQAAGLPARRVVISSSALDRVHEVLAALPASYRLAADEQIAKDTERLVWAIDPDPAVAN